MNKAKQSLQERLSLLEGQGQGGYQQRYGNAYGSSGSEKYVAATGCASCIGGSESYSSRYILCSRKLFYSLIKQLGAIPNDFLTQSFDLVNSKADNETFNFA